MHARLSLHSFFVSIYDFLTRCLKNSQAQSSSQCHTRATPAHTRYDVNDVSVAPVRNTRHGDIKLAVTHNQLVVFIESGVSHTAQTLGILSV